MEKIKNNGFLKFLLKFIKTICVIFIVLVASVVLVQRVSNNKFNLGGFSVYTIITGSMIPDYNVYDMVIAKTVDPKDIKIGDDVVYKGEVNDFKDKIITHRVISIKKGSDGYNFVTKGIANSIEDPEINESQIYAKVLCKSYVLSFLSKILNNIYAFYFVIFIPIAIMIFLEILDIINEKKELDEEERKENLKQKEE